MSTMITTRLWLEGGGAHAVLTCGTTRMGVMYVPPTTPKLEMANVPP